MGTAVEIAIALFIFVAIFSLLRGNWAGAIAAVAAALTLGLLSVGHGDERDRWGA
jgi:hypothetical protein